ncbi:MAG: hypothetical protein CMM45_12980 [Rhodospirillaceae bacterium]|nr:hypothetical protein [Rhodospirillaceae bacterium]
MHRRMIQVIATLAVVVWLSPMAKASGAGVVQRGFSVADGPARDTFAQINLRPSKPPLYEADPEAARSTDGPGISGGLGEPQLPGFLSQKVRRVIDLQRRMVLGLGRYMADIRAGGGVGALWVGIWFAFLYGAVHAVGPGHGKMVVASFFVGREAKLWRGVAMGFQIAVTHVIAAVLLVWLVDISFRHFIGGSPAESLWIRMVSFGLIAAIGFFLLSRAVRKAFTAVRYGLHHLHATGHDHHHHDLGHQGLLAFVAGAVPCTGAILVMLFALANGMIGTGVILVAAISVGMAITMSAFGVISILFRRLVINFLGAPKGRTQGKERPEVAIATAVLEHAGALLILFIGLSFFTATFTEWRP